MDKWEKYKRQISAGIVLVLWILTVVYAADAAKARGQAESLKAANYIEGTGIEEEFYSLRTELTEMILDQPGEYSIYLKDLETGEELSLNHREMYAASLIKLFVMARTYEYFEEITGWQADEAEDLAKGQEEITTYLEQMIQVSDNESFNELVRAQDADHSFSEGCRKMNAYLEEQGYEDTGIYHTLEPSVSEEEEISEEKNHTSARDCGRLLENIYEGKCVSEEASLDMLALLTGQERDWKIPAGLPEGTLCANKTGETDTCQHDAAIVFGPEKDYILCVMSDGLEGEQEGEDAALLIRDISRTVYEFLEQEEE